MEASGALRFTPEQRAEYERVKKAQGRFASPVTFGPSGPRGFPGSFPS